MNKSFYKRILFMVSLVVVVLYSFLSFYYISYIQREMENRTMEEMGFTAAQIRSTVDSKMESVTNISKWIIMDGEINQILNHNYSRPYEYLKFYNLLEDFCTSMIELVSDIRVITFFTTNDTIKEDKKNVRYMEELKDETYEAVIERRGGLLFCMMRDAVEAEYFDYNEISSPDNICILRRMEDKGVENVLLIEIKDSVFHNEFCREPGKGMYVEDSTGKVLFFYENGQKLEADIFDQEEKDFKKENIYLTETLDNQWTMTLFENRHMVLTEVNATTRNLILFNMLSILIILLVYSFAMKSTSTRLLKLNSVIQKAYQISGDEQAQVSSDRMDEVDQVMDSFEHMMQRVEYLMNEVYKKEIQNKNMELELLHSQIKPHFLYNTLSSMASLARRHQYEPLMKMITSLSDLYRISLSRGRKIITVEKEIEMTRAYLAIMESRFEDLIHVDFQIQEEAKKGLVPKILVQPFVENSINHAIRPDRILNIVVDIRKVEDKLVFQIYDDGLGMDENQVKELLNRNEDDSMEEHGYGISNVNRRIKVYMGEEYGVEILSQKNVGTNVKITMPYWEKMEEMEFTK